MFHYRGRLGGGPGGGGPGGLAGRGGLGGRGPGRHGRLGHQGAAGHHWQNGDGHLLGIIYISSFLTYARTAYLGINRSKKEFQPQVISEEEAISGNELLLWKNMRI
ncbi:MAG: hypothetical protein LKJ17_10475 [Oscillospiraceae bacterium]|nr:hypothetical protein [Oscillospiraceae bacterium]